MKIDLVSNGYISALVLSVVFLGTSGCTYFSQEARIERLEDDLVFSFAEYQPKAKELEGLLSEAIEASPSITPVCYIAGFSDFEFVLRKGSADEFKNQGFFLMN